MFQTITATALRIWCPSGAKTTYSYTLTSPSKLRFPTLGFNRCQRILLPPAACDSVEAFDYKAINGMEFFEVEFKVRACELDQYGVVNNAVYATYCEHASHELRERIGISADAVSSGGNVFAISNQSFKFLSPLRNGDRFVVKVRISSISAVRIIFEHLIFKLPNHEPILEAKATTLFLDRNYRPVRPPPEMKLKMTQFRRSRSLVE